MQTTEAITIDRITADADDLGMLPQVVMRVIALTNEPGATTAEVQRAVAADPILAARVLTLANSAYYGMPRHLSSLREAVVFLGFKAVRTIAMGVTTFSSFLGKSDADALARRAVWRHSLNTALCARTLMPLLASSVQEAFTADEAFTGGLLHDIGKMALDRSCHDAFLTLTQRADAEGLRFSDVEVGVLPFGHGLIGAAIAQNWNLPLALCETIAFHHTPRAAMTNPRLTAAVSLANELAHTLDSVPPADDLHDRVGEMLPPLRLSGDALPRLLGSCRVEMDKGWQQLFLG